MATDPLILENTIIIDNPIADSTAAMVIIKIELICPRSLFNKNPLNKKDIIIDNNIISKQTKIIIILERFIEIPNILKVNKNKGKVYISKLIILILNLLLIIHKLIL